MYNNCGPGAILQGIAGAISSPSQEGIKMISRILSQHAYVKW
jgi:hypothetical protein